MDTLKPLTCFALRASSKSLPLARADLSELELPAGASGGSIHAGMCCISTDHCGCLNTQRQPVGTTGSQGRSQHPGLSKGLHWPQHSLLVTLQFPCTLSMT